MIRLNKLLGTLAFVTMFLYSSLISYSAEYLVPAWDQFGGAQIDSGTFTVQPGDSGFSVRGDKDIQFTEAGQITVNATPPAGESLALRFVFEDVAQPATAVSFEVSLPLDSSTQVDSSNTYIVEVPAQPNGTSFTNLVMFLDGYTSVSIADVTVSHDGADQNASGAESSYVIESGNWSAFEGAVIDENGYFVFPTLNESQGDSNDPNSPWVEAYAGFQNTDTLALPATFTGGGSIVFEAAVPSGESVDVRFTFEDAPWSESNQNPTQVTTDVITISGSGLTTYTLNIPVQAANYNSVPTWNNLLFFIEQGFHNIPVQLGNVTINDDAYTIPTTTPPPYGVQFKFEDRPYPNVGAVLESSWVEIDSYDLQSYTINMPAYDGSLGSISETTPFRNALLYFAGNDQAIIIRDITIQVGDTVFGGSNEDSLLYESIFGGLQYNEGTTTYNLPTGAQSWAGSALSPVVGNDGTTQPGFLDGTLLNEPITITFSAALSEESFDPPPTYKGENAFGDDGSINTGAPTEAGTSGDELRWSGYVTRFELAAGETQGDWIEGLSWGLVEDLPATWSEDGVLTLAPNTNQFAAWSDQGETDGKYYLDSVLRIEGDTGTSKLLGSTVNLSGNISSYTLDDKYKVTAFIRTIDVSITDGSNIVQSGSQSVEVDENTGDFVITANIPVGENLIPSIGFSLEGRNTSTYQDYGNIQISNVVANFTPTSTITDAHFTGTSTYWTAGAGSAVQFDDSDGNGVIKGQAKVISNGDRGTKYVVSNNGTPEPLANLGIATDNIYNLSFYMNRTIGSTDMGYAEISFYEADGETLISKFPADSSVSHAASDNLWTQYSQQVVVPSNAVTALIKLYGGSLGTAIAFDDIYLNYVSEANTLDIWASNYGLTLADAAFNADPDNDGLSNAIENYLGTDPSNPSSGLSNIAYSSNELSFEHSKNSNIASDVQATYLWSTDLNLWLEDGATYGGTTVDIVVVDDSTSGISTATADVTGTNPESLYIKLEVSADNN